MSILGNSLLVYLKCAEHCNLSCLHCFYASGKAPKQLLDIDEAIKWFHKLHDSAPWVESPAINFFGGEPMLAPIESLNRFIDSTSHLWQNRIRYTITTNLVYPLIKSKLNFLKRLNGVSTSWDSKSRFANEDQFNLWKSNCISLIKDHGIDLTLQICLTEDTLKLPVTYIFDMVKEIGFSDVQFEKLSITGEMLENPQLLPDNKSLDSWFVEMYNIYKDGKYYEHFSNAYLNSIFSSILYNTFSGCRSRNCMTKVFTINSDQTIATCPNYSLLKDHQIGNMSQPILELLTSRTRQKSITCEATVNPVCQVCPVYSICNSGCSASTTVYPDGSCSEAKSLMIYLQKEKNYSLYKEIIGDFQGQEKPINQT